MPKFGSTSMKNLSSCHPNLQRLATEVIKYVDHCITCGHRDQVAQDKAFAEGKSKLKWPNGEHNRIPSNAMDVAPYLTDWNDTESFTLLAGMYYGIACTMGIKIRLGIDWDGDFKTSDHKFKDRPHIELKGE